eukprot:2514460-Karenia_brevis.AAC.1
MAPPPGLQKGVTTVARMGRLGFDRPAHEVETMAAETLGKAGVDPSSYRDVSAVRETGSLAEIIFGTSLDLRIAKSKVRKLRVTVPGASGPVWIDEKKSFEELRPSRMVRRAQTFIEDMISKPNDGVEWKFDNGAKKIKANGQTVAYCLRGNMLVLPAADQFMDQENKK